MFFFLFKQREKRTKLREFEISVPGLPIYMYTECKDFSINLVSKNLKALTKFGKRNVKYYIRNSNGQIFHKLLSKVECQAPLKMESPV